MSRTRLIALCCKIIRGVVPDEKAFEIALADNRLVVGVAPAHYFWDDRGQRLPEDMPASDQEIPGMVAARLLERTNGTALVSVPDGSVVHVKVDQIKNRPSEIVFDVPVRPGS